MEIIEDCTELEWRTALFKHYNILLFKDEKGQKADFRDKLNDHIGVASGGSTMTFLAKLWA
ncbi:hypothetical protein J3R82DRAFT_11353 [Butyriboletus roseoflavus]|nr:hypothetical protein J3R82DRAFT_11353 [Butyriboletus roseoflavus]